MKQRLRKYQMALLIGFLTALLPGQALATSYNSAQTGNWTTTSTWSPAGNPVNGDGIQILSGHTVTYTGNLSWTSGSIQIAGGGTLIINGNLTLNGASLQIDAGSTLIVNGSLVLNSTLNTNGTLSATGDITITGDLNASGTVTAGGALSISGSMNSSANVNVQTNLSVGGSLSATGGLLHVGGDLTVINQLATLGSSTVIDIDGNASVKLLYTNGGTVVIDKNLTLSGQLGSAGTTVVGGNYVVVGGAPTYVSSGHFFVFGSNNCATGDCGNIGNESAWNAAGSPGSSYVTTSPSWWTNHLANAGKTSGPTTVCKNTTFSVNAVSAGAGNLASNTFEWAVYGGTITANTGGTPISANSGTVGGHTASVLSYAGIAGQTAYTITVNWTENTFSGAYVAVRQTSADGCSDGKWSVYTLNVALTAAPTASSPQTFCSNDSPTVADLLATGSTGATFNWYSAATGGSALPATTVLTDGTTYYATQVVGGCESATRTPVTVTVGDLQFACPSDASVGCVTDLPVITNFTEFKAAGGTYTNTCADLAGVTLKVADVIVPANVSASGNCEVKRTFSVMDGTTVVSSCIQTITLTDSNPPVLTGASGGVLPAVSFETPGCPVAIAIPAFSGSCSGVTYSYTISPAVAGLVLDTNNKVLSGTFAEGNYVITWTIASVCGTATATATQGVVVASPVITYDSFAAGSLPTGLGSGVKPLQTSTHTYQVDGGVAQGGVAYTWELLGANAADLTMSGQGTASISLEFKSTLAAGSYTLKVTKNNGCEVAALLPLVVSSNADFDVDMTILGDQCQNPGTSTTYFWTITFPNGFDTEPYRFGYELTFDGVTVLTGTVGSITSASRWTLNPASGTPPLVQTSKSDDYKVVLYFTFPSAGDRQLPISLKVTATDAYQVSVPQITNNLSTHKTPTISF